jgi:hypothetical protein
MSWKSESLNLLELYGPYWAFYRTPLPFTGIKYIERVIAQHILNLSAGWMSVLSFTPHPLYS